MRPPALRPANLAVAVAGFLTAAFACSASAPTEPVERSILFIGNSLTYMNDLPAMMERIGEAAGDPVRVGEVTGGNMAVIDHVNRMSEAIPVIDTGGWAFVVLQQGPTPAGICRDTLVLATMRAGPHIAEAGGRAVLWLPWARRGFPATLGPAGVSATEAARTVGGIVAPIGVAWAEALERDPTLPLYGGDGYHPAPGGSLLAALTIYDRVFGGDVRRIPADALARIPAGGLTPAQIRTLVEAAHEASVALPADPTTPVPADTTAVSPLGGGPC
ncbi:MAG TPA: hypothetical protein VEB59_04735 [Gemmatimonadales bacterium]|nr:hypothetical protein [Gemmatimonadales bacterium]